MPTQTFVPIRTDGRTTMVQVSAESDALDLFRAEENQRRLFGITKRRMYANGTQFNEQNQKERDEYCQDGKRPLPEHKRLHAYSTQIQACVNFVSNRVSESFQINAQNAEVQKIVDDLITSSDQLWTYNEQGEVVPNVANVLTDSIIAGDVAVYVGWDAVEGQAYLELWEAENVQFITENTRTVEAVERTEMLWRDDGSEGGRRQVVEIDRYERSWNPFLGIRDVKRTVQWADEEEPHITEWLGMGRLPWVLLRARSAGLRELRGESLISEQTMEQADRYNAVEQVGFLIARYNSHANVAVIGDASLLKVESEGRVNKDVADVLTFPGGTSLQVLELPTDPKMIEHQRIVLSEALYSQFGVTRLEPDSLQGLGALSGYALEILNEKSQATFGAIVRQWRKDWANLIHMVLDVTAWKQGGDQFLIDEEGLAVPLDTDDEMSVGAGMTDWTKIDPATVYPERRLAIRMGTGYIVDDARVRDDFVAKLISRREALIQRGYTPEDAERITGEVNEEMAALAGPSFGSFTEGWPTNGTKAGATTRTTARA